MADNLIYLITGANRGIGRAMAAILLARPSTTVVAAVRDASHPTAASLASLPAAAGSRLVVVPLDAAVPAIAHDSLPARLAAQGVARLDVVVANAGAASGFKHILDTTPAEVAADVEVNAVGPLRLFQATWPLQQEGSRKFVLVTSSAGSIANLALEDFPYTSYGMSKAAANWFAKKASVEFAGRGLKVGIVHPGWVKTPMGQGLADALQYPEPPMTVEDSARRTLEQIDRLSAETSGDFVSYNGSKLDF